MTATIVRRLQIDDGEEGRIIVMRRPNDDDHAFEVNAGEMNKERLVWLTLEDARTLARFLAEEITLADARTKEKDGPPPAPR